MKYVIQINGGFYDGLYGGRKFQQAKQMTRDEARVLNRVIMAGRGKVLSVRQAAKKI